MNSSKDYCEGCSDPLGATRPLCFDCGGTQSRGPRITPEKWQVLLGAFGGSGGGA